MAAARIVVVGASAGGIDAVRAVLSRLPADFPAPVAVVIHTAPQSPGILDEILDRATPLRVLQANTGARLKAGLVFVAPPDHHLLIEPGIVRVSRGPRENRFRPAVDPLFRSAAQVYGPGTVGVVLTGNLDDGTAGLKAVKQLGGTAVVQDPDEAEYPSMPHSAVSNVKVDYVLRLADIAGVLSRIVANGAQPVAEVAVPQPIEVETRIARGESPREAGLERIATPSMFACPECHGALLQVKDSTPLRFRCHTGHPYSSESLLAEMAESVETTLWKTIRAMQEASMLAEHLAAHARQHGNADTASRLEGARTDMRKRADQLRQIVKERETTDAGRAAE